MACYDTALPIRETRKQFANKPIASNQLVQEKIGLEITEIVERSMLALHVGRIKDDGEKPIPRTSTCWKMNNVAIALDMPARRGATF